jgi:hypothetical protein
MEARHLAGQNFPDFLKLSAAYRFDWFSLSVGNGIMALRDDDIT